MTTLYDLQKEYEELETEKNKIQARQDDIVYFYKQKLALDILEGGLLKLTNWSVSNCGYETIRIESQNYIDYTKDFEPLFFVSGHAIQLLNGVTLGIYRKLQLIFKNIETAKRFIEKYNLLVNGMEKRIKINELQNKFTCFC